EAGDGHLPLVMLDEHEAGQFGAEMAADTAGLRSDQRATVRGLPTFPAIAHDMRANDEVLDDEVFIALEPRPLRNRRLAAPLLVDGPLGRLVATATARPVRCRSWLARLLHPARLSGLDVRPAFQPLQPRDLLALLADNPG